MSTRFCGNEFALNGICPYFTMFPLDFPLGVLQGRMRRYEMVLDPFCGRGTTNFASRILGLNSLGVDSSRVAVAITSSKLVNVTADELLEEAITILKRDECVTIPEGEFWNWAYHKSTLRAICRFREAFLNDCSTPARIALRGVILGALHGPKRKTFPSYFSNQAPRSYAPKPAYATRFWRERRLKPEPLNILEIIERRANRFFQFSFRGRGIARLADSRKADALRPIGFNEKFSWVITSPPYYGMRTYIADQWLRHWFLGGPSTVEYSSHDQIVHSSPEEFANDLRTVWLNAAGVSRSGARLVIRFGGISDRNVEPLQIIKHSLTGSGWRLMTAKHAGTAARGRRQADSFLRSYSAPLLEYDLWAVRE